jgi:hypothetical protein
MLLVVPSYLSRSFCECHVVQLFMESFPTSCRYFWHIGTTHFYPALTEPCGSHASHLKASP